MSFVNIEKPAAGAEGPRMDAEWLDAHWMPYTANRQFKANPRMIVEASGAWTGAEAFGVTPDILNFAKQVTNGAQPLGGVVATKEIYDTFMAAGGPEYMLEFPHGYTYSAHPVACAAGIAALDILQKEDMIGRVKALAPYFERAVHSLKGAKHVADIRNFGLAAGFTIAALPGEPAKRPYEIAMNCWKKGFYVRYGGDTIQLAPPFISTQAEIDRLISALGDALQETA